MMDKERGAKRAIVSQTKSGKVNVCSISRIAALHALYPICQSDKRTDPVCCQTCLNSRGPPGTQKGGLSYVSNN